MKTITTVLAALLFIQQNVLCDDADPVSTGLMGILSSSTTASSDEDCCFDQIGWENCTSYRLESCLPPYNQWAGVRCQAFCGMCKPCRIEPCVDAIENCDRYGETSCVDDVYRMWAMHNCRKTCNLCDNYGFYNLLQNRSATPTESAVTATAATSSSAAASQGQGVLPSVQCQDVINHCDEYGTGDCTRFPRFMTAYCPLYCGFCTESQLSTSAAPSTSASVTGICVDVSANCSNVRLEEGCCGLNAAWSQTNCARYCGYCGEVPDRLCEDTVDNCDQQPEDMCTNPLWDLFRQNNCAGYCNICDRPWQPPSCTAGLFPTPPVVTDHFVPVAMTETSTVSTTQTQPTSTTESLPESTTTTTSVATSEAGTPFVTGQLCVDISANCTDVRPEEGCCGLNEAWSRANCARYCGFCGVVPDRLCDDTTDDCDRIADDLCTNPLYDVYRQNNCAGYCRICDRPWQPPSCTADLFREQPATQPSENSEQTSSAPVVPSEAIVG